MTLIDTMISVAILLIITTFTVLAMSNAVRLNGYMKSQDNASRAVLTKLRHELQLAFLTEDLTTTETYRTVFVGEDQDPDVLYFATRAHQRLYRDARESDQAEITVWAERMPDVDGLEGEGYVIYHPRGPAHRRGARGGRHRLPAGVQRQGLHAALPRRAEERVGRRVGQPRLGPPQPPAARRRDRDGRELPRPAQPGRVDREAAEDHGRPAIRPAAAVQQPAGGWTMSHHPEHEAPARRGLAWLWHELTRPRGSVSHRFYRVGRSSRSGVALLIVITCILFLTMVGAEITGTATVRMRLAANQRDEAMAEQLAYTGLGFYRLILVTANGLDGKLNSQSGQVAQMLKQFGVNGDMLWQMVPFINTNLLRMVFVAGGDLDEDERAEMEERGLTEEEREDSRSASSSMSKPGFLDFEGDFFAEVEDETQRINIRDIKGANIQDLQNHPAAVQLLGLMTGTQTCRAIEAGREASYEDTEDNTMFFRDRDLEPLELIGNLADWVDKDGERAYLGGDENSLYDRLEEPYKVKNAPFDSLEEVRLVDGWHRDDVWERFGDKITVYGAHSKVNVNSAECEVLWALLKSFSDPPPADFTIHQCIQAINNYRMVVPFANEDSFINTGPGRQPADRPRWLEQRGQLRDAATSRTPAA